MQFRDRAFCFLNRLHLHKREPFRALVVTVTDYFRILDVPDTVKQVEQITLSRVKREIPDIQPGRTNFDRFGFTLRTRWLLLRRTIAPSADWFLLSLAVAEKSCQKLPECFFGSFGRRLLMTRTTIAPSVGTASRTPRTSPR